MSSSRPPTTITWWITGSASLVTLVRVGVGYQPHSGQDDYQGPHLAQNRATAAVYGGDYEAQRHWMELTCHLPLREWYYDDPSYWGLDYPPLTAYHSYVCGGIGQVVFQFVDAFAWETSRGYEDPLHKAYMRSTVIVSDWLCYGTVMGMFVVAAAPHRSSFLTPCWHFIYGMIQPAIVLIDHGHFQYNTVALGLSLWSIYYITKKDNASGNMTNCMMGSVFFCCALSFKQMTLYYAPAIFCYLLGRCFAKAQETDTTSPRDHRINTSSYVATITYRIAALGITVVATLTLLWWPFIVYGPEDTTTIERAQHIFQRIIPIRRGLFEGKVSNLWCALSVSPFRIRQRIPTLYQPVAALLLTLVLLIPSSFHLFNVGRNCHRNPLNHNHNHAGGHYSSYSFDRQQLLWGTTNSALAFFLASFQVHEKSLLLALAPCSLLLTADPKFVHWFSIVTVWTLWPLLQIDRLQTAYVCTIILFLSMTGLSHELMSTADVIPSSEHPTRAVGFFEYYSSYYFNWIPAISYTIMMLLHAAECIVVVPKHLPDLFPVLWSIVGCGFCCLAYIVTFWHMLFNQQTMSTVSTRIDSVTDASKKVKVQ